MTVWLITSAAPGIVDSMGSERVGFLGVRHHRRGEYDPMPFGDFLANVVVLVLTFNVLIVWV